ncbi:uncharacterized protein LOC143187726 [Calliopsis andreniformis]|uniref:uncharacterized protein LOC143187726 n=1 Tax=Calliopsis andreniformis TaxID=337506 RepID=UPI003FCD5A8A
MFSANHNVKSTLLCGPAELSKSFMFETAFVARAANTCRQPLFRRDGAPRLPESSFPSQAAIYWAEEGRRVVYVTPAPLEKLPAACHDRSNPAPAAFKLMRFMYLENYEALVERLVELHTFATLPSVLLIDDFDEYVKEYEKSKTMRDVHVAKMCSLILDTMNSCARILKMSVYVCAWSSSAMNDVSTYTIYFHNIWNVTEEEDGKTILLQKYSNEASTEKCPSYKYCKLQDGTRILKQILYESVED